MSNTIKRIFTIGFSLPGSEFEYVDADSTQTLLDADIVLFEPTLQGTPSHRSYNGKPVLDEHSSFRSKERVDHWRTEISAAVSAGRLVIVFLEEPIEYFRHTGTQTHSGTGRSRVTTDIVTEVSSYDAIPKLTTVTQKSGSVVRLERDAQLIATYWSEFGSISNYKVTIAGDFSDVLLKSKAGDMTVGAISREGDGCLLFLPPIGYDREKFTQFDETKRQTFWTKEAFRFGKRLVTILVAIHDSIREASNRTPAPLWSLASAFRLSEEQLLENRISDFGVQLSALQGAKSAAEAALRESSRLRGLLYEQGKPLEKAILIALRAFGFAAQPFEEGDSEFDSVFVCTEGRCLGEAEGKDTKAINIDKMSQLERNLQEDFARESITAFAKGVLFGNAYRLSELKTRKDFFTDKCKSAAVRARVALVRTPDMFAPAKYLIEHPEDSAFAAACRLAILQTDGAVVIFPEPPGDIPGNTIIGAREA